MAAHNSTSASINAQVSVSPILSHSVLTAMLILSAIPLLSGFIFLWHEKDGSWIPFLIFFLLIVIVCVGWWHSQKAIDWGNSKPTKISDNNGNSVTTDSRTFDSEHAVARIGSLFSSMGMRNPLPEPDGLVGSVGVNQPNTKQEAIETVNIINNKTTKLTQNFINDISRASTEAVEAVQNTVDTAEGTYNDVLKYNQTTKKEDV